MNIKDVLLSFDGRINRWEFWVKGLVPWIGVEVAFAGAILGLSLLLASVVDNGESLEVNFGRWVMLLSLIGLLPFTFFSIYVHLAIFSKRWHDLGRSGRWNWFLFIPILGWAVFILYVLILGLMRGKREENQYGPIPG